MTDGFDFLVVERYCSECETWSPDDDWEEGDVFFEDVIVESYVECPNCEHHFPSHDPPTR
jgi:hypothetical protein